MKKIGLMSIVLMLSLALTGCGEKKQITENAPVPPTPPTPVVTEPVKDTFSGNVEELLARGKSVKCVTTDETDGTKMEGEFYVDGVGARTKSITKITAKDGKIENSNMLMTKEAIYMWPEGAKEGLKMPVAKPEAAENTKDVPVSKNYPEVDKRDQKYNFSCEAWTLDEAVFVIPADVKFIDQAAQMRDAMEKSGVDLEALKAEAMKNNPQE